LGGTVTVKFVTQFRFLFGRVHVYFTVLNAWSWSSDGDEQPE